MSIVSAYTELPPGQVPNYLPLQQEGVFEGKTSEGLSVDWGYPDPPEEAQVYLYWEPKVVAVWEETEIEDGTEIEQPGPDPVPKLDLSAGEGGERVGDVPTSAAPES